MLRLIHGRFPQKRRKIRCRIFLKKNLCKESVRKIRRKQHEKTALSAIMSAFVDDGRGK